MAPRPSIGPDWVAAPPSWLLSVVDVVVVIDAALLSVLL
jgi:hypothetical protein